MEPTAFRKHLVAELDSVHRLAFHLTGNADEAAELTQQTCTRALQAAGRFELRDAGMRPWLFKILHNCFYTKRGREQKAPALTGDLEWEVPQKPASNARPAWTLSQFDWQQVDERIKHAVESLEPRYREVLLLWAIEGRKYREIAEHLAIPIGTVMSRLSRARAMLHQTLQPLAAQQRIGTAGETDTSVSAESDREATDSHASEASAKTPLGEVSATPQAGQTVGVAA